MYRLPWRSTHYPAADERRTSELLGLGQLKVRCTTRVVLSAALAGPLQPIAFEGQSDLRRPLFARV